MTGSSKSASIGLSTFLALELQDEEQAIKVAQHLAEMLHQTIHRDRRGRQRNCR